MHEQITAEQYDSWSEEQCAGIEIVDGMAVVSPRANRRPDVVVYRADTIDITPTRPEHVLLVVEVVSPGSETTDRIVKTDQYAKSGIAFYWRVEQAATGVPLVYAYVLDPATRAYRDGDVFTCAVKVSAPFPVEFDLGQI